MALTERRGSIFGKLLVVIFGAGLIFAIFYPKTLWDEVDEKTKLSRSRMQNIWTAETFYKSRHKTFTDTIEVLIEKVKKDSMFSWLQDSLLTMPLDCVRFDPFNGEPFIITMQDSTPLLVISSPVIGDTSKVLGLFTVEIKNPGQVADGHPSWEK